MMTQWPRYTELFCAACLLAAPASTPADEPRATPNVIFILGDDLGYGDFGCYGATKIKTPHVDRLAQEGLRFTDAHSPSSMCTPTRYAFLTGEYAWRRPGGAGVLSGVAPLAILPGRPTVATMLKQAGYATAVVGKWHLGLGAGPTDYNQPLKPGPLEIGFDYAFFIPATGDRVPCVYVENHDIVGYDPADPIAVDYRIVRGDPKSFVAGIPRIGGMTGGKSAVWSDADMADTLAAKAIEFIEQHRAEPFFLYLPTHDAHVPRVPHSRYRGSSDAGVRGDVVQEFDGTVGAILQTLDRLKLADRTLVLVSSDNGGVLDGNGPDTENAGTEITNNGHLYNGPLRGKKGDLYEGGHRVPLVVRWPGRVPAGGVSGQLASLVDLFATLAAVVGQPLGEDAAPDSFNLLPALLDLHAPPVREYLVNHTSGIPGRLAIRQGPWKYAPSAYRGGGNRQRTRPDGSKTQPVPESLYNLDDDLDESENLIDEYPQRAAELRAKLEEIRSATRSRPSP